MTEWIPVTERLPEGMAGKYTVRLENGDEKKAYYYSDAMAWITWYGHKSCYWWDCSRNNDPLHDVTHWMPSPQIK